LQLAAPVQVKPHVCPEQLTSPEQDLAPVQVISLASAVAVTVAPHDVMPEHPMVHDPLVQVIGPEHAPMPQVTRHDAPPHDTAPQEFAAEQSIVQELAEVQSTDAADPVPTVTAQGMPGGQVTLPPQLPAAGQAMTHDPSLQVPASQSVAHAERASPWLPSAAPASATAFSSGKVPSDALPSAIVSAAG
jgi:hypothetical protein